MIVSFHFLKSVFHKLVLEGGDSSILRYLLYRKVESFDWSNEFNSIMIFLRLTEVKRSLVVFFVRKKIDFSGYWFDNFNQKSDVPNLSLSSKECEEEGCKECIGLRLLQGMESQDIGTALQRKLNSFLHVELRYPEIRRIYSLLDMLVLGRFLFLIEPLPQSQEYQVYHYTTSSSFYKPL